MNRNVLRLVSIFSGLLGACAQGALSIITAALPAATVGQPYSTTIMAQGVSPPYIWALAGPIPQGLNLSLNSGVLSGTAQGTGAYPFTIRVSDAAGSSSTRSFTLTVNQPPPVIASDNPLFDGTVGSFYSQTVRASGGVPPYKWKLLAGQLPPGLSLDSQGGAISGTPTAAGTFGFTLQVSDAAGASVSKSFNITVHNPTLVITAPSALPDGTVGTLYMFRMTATGGVAPLTWSISLTPPGLMIDSASGVLTGTPTNAGAFKVSVQVKDAAGATTTKSSSLSIKPGPLSITTVDQLPGVTIGAPFSFTFMATGGAPPYRWFSNGLPDGLLLDPDTGTLSGATSTPGNAAFTVRVADSTVSAATALFHLRVTAPPLSAVRLTGPPDSTDPAQQADVHLDIAEPYPVDIMGQLTLTFAPDAGLGDSTVQFSTGGRTVPFTIPGGTTSAQFPSRLAIQTGTVSGSITISTQLQVGQADVTPVSTPKITTRVNKTVPVISSAKLTRNSTGFSIEVLGYSPTVEITTAVFKFKSETEAMLANTQVQLAVSDLFAKWFQDPASSRFGGQFTFTQSFSVQGDANAVLPYSVTLTNRIGETTLPVQ